MNQSESAIRDGCLELPRSRADRLCRLDYDLPVCFCRQEADVSRKWVRVAIVIVLCVAALAGGLALRGGRSLPDEFDRSASSSATGLTRVLFSEDGRTLFAAGGDGSVVQWTMPGQGRGEVLTPAGKVPVTVLSLSPDGLLLAGDLSGRLRVWKLPSLKPIDVKSPAVPATCVVFRESSGKQQMLLGMADGRVVTVDDDGVTPRETGHRGVKAMILDSTGTQLISGGSEGALIWYDLEKQSQVAKVAEHSTEISTVVLSSKGDAVISADWNGHVRVTSEKDRKPVAEFSQTDAVSALAERDGVIVTSSWDGFVRVWRISGRAGELITEFDTGAPVLDLALSADGKSAATVSGSGKVDFWKLP